MAMLHLMVGLPCAGKTTRAKEIVAEREAAGAVCLRVSPDVWITAICGPNAPRDQIDAARQPAEDLAWDVASHILRLGGEVILDFGFWGRGEREDYRGRAEQLGAAATIHFLDEPLEPLLARMHARNRALQPGEMLMTEDDMRQAHAIIERPDAAELSRSGA